MITRHFSKFTYGQAVFVPELGLRGKVIKVIFYGVPEPGYEIRYPCEDEYIHQEFMEEELEEVLE